MKQVDSSPSTKTIADLLGMMRRQELILQPDFQRKLVWSREHKELFIETILKGLPFPEIYIAQSGIDLDTFENQQVVVDGQQRLSTIMSYAQNALECKRISKYCELDDVSKKEFLSYDVVVRDLKGAHPDVIKDIFKRINQTQYRLNNVEIDNAVYEGVFISTAKKIVDTINKDDFHIFSDSELSRMKDLEFILMVMSTIEEGGYFSNDTQVNQYIVKYDDEYANSDKIFNDIMNTFEVIRSLNLSEDSIWYRKSNFFTLFVQLVWLGDVPDKFEDKIKEFELNVMKFKDSKDSDFGQYYSAMYTGTNSRTSRLKRSELFVKYCVKADRG